MTVHSVAKFTPEILLSSARRSYGAPNADGTRVLYSVSSYSFDQHARSSEIRVLDLATGESSCVVDSQRYSSPTWLDNDTIVLLKSLDGDRTELLTGSCHNFKHHHHVAGSIDAPAKDLKITKLQNGSYGIALSAPSNPDGSLATPRKAKTSHSSGRLYRSLFVRHWDRWITRERSAIWYGTFTKDSGALVEPYRYSVSPLHNPLRGTNLECPMPEFGGVDHFDISPAGLVFVSKDPNLDPAVNTKCRMYIVRLTTFCEEIPTVYEIQTPPEMQGAMTSPVFSLDGSKAAVLMMRENGYESDKNELLVLPDVSTPGKLVHLLNSEDEKAIWDRSPSSVQFSADNSRLYLTAEDQGQTQVFTLSTDPKAKQPPQPVTAIEGDISAIRVLPKSLKEDTHTLFISSTSLVENSAYSLVTITYYPAHSNASTAAPLPAAPTVNTHPVSLFSGNGSQFGLHPSQISNLYTHHADHKATSSPSQVHSWLVKPSDFDPANKYPLAFLIHGGPQGAWLNAWSTRWNPAVFAEQGYIVVCPNPTGSTGYGQAFCDAIKEQWGGLPYQDLVNCFEYIEREVDFVDTDRAVALGGSYGGYMVNWIQGHPFGRKFKALVTHDGVYSTNYELATEELYFIHREFGGHWSENKEKYIKWSPDQFTQNWKTPHLIIHSEKDYRLTISDGLAAFNILQIQRVESELLTFPDENHWILSPENSLVWHETVLNFINKYIGLPPYRENDDKEIIQDPWRPAITPAQPPAVYKKAE